MASFQIRAANAFLVNFTVGFFKTFLNPSMLESFRILFDKALDQDDW
jgi:hypothetical protein